MELRVEFDPAAERESGKIDPQIARRILAFLQDRLAHIDNPRSVGKALKGSTLGEFRRSRRAESKTLVSSSVRGWAMRQTCPTLMAR